MQSISSCQGKTVLFVSHNLDAIQRICSDAIYLKDGRVEYMGGVGSATESYLSRGEKASEKVDFSAVTERWGSGLAKIVGLDILDGSGRSVNVLQAGETYQFELSYSKCHDVTHISDVVASLALKDTKGVTVLLVSSDFVDKYFEITVQRNRIRCRIVELGLASGAYTITLFLGRRGGETLDCLNDVARITVAGGDFFGTGHPGLPDHCRTLSHAEWTTLG